MAETGLDPLRPLPVEPRPDPVTVREEVGQLRPHHGNYISIVVGNGKSSNKQAVRSVEQPPQEQR